MNDLIILVADKNMHFALRGALSRPEALGIRAITLQFLEHSMRDGGGRCCSHDSIGRFGTGSGRRGSSLQPIRNRFARRRRWNA
jgi:hypothetical protein